MLKRKELGKAIKVAVEKKLEQTDVKSKAEIARHFGVKAPSLFGWMASGAVGKERLEDLFEYFSDVCEPSHWGLSNDSKFLDSGTNVKSKQPNYPKIVGTARMGNDGYYLDLGESSGYVEHQSPEGSIAIHVRGDSMHPAIRDGWYIIVEPDTEVHPGEYVLVAFNDGKKMVKELLYEKSDCFVLLSVNSDERITALKEDIEHIQGVSAVVPPSKRKEF